MKLVRPEEVPTDLAIRTKDTLAAINTINSGLLEGKLSFNNRLSLLNVGEEQLHYIAERFKTVGWNVKVFRDEFNTYTIKFDKQ